MDISFDTFQSQKLHMFFTSQSHKELYLFISFPIVCIHESSHVFIWMNGVFKDMDLYIDLDSKTTLKTLLHEKFDHMDIYFDIFQIQNLHKI